MINIKHIKKLVEAKSGIKNIAAKSRKENLIFARSVAYRLVKDFIHTRDGSLSNIAEEFNLISHATIISSLKGFGYLYNNREFKPSKDIYLDIKAELMIKSALIIVDEVNCNTLYSLSLSEMEKKYISNDLAEQNTLAKELNKYKDSESLSKIADLSYEDFKEFEKRTEMFIKSLEWKNKQKLNNLSISYELVK